MKYIDAEHLRKDVKKLERAAHKSALSCADSETRKFHEGKDFAYQHIGTLLNTIPEQEHPIYELNQILLDWMREAKTDKEQEARFEAYKRFFELYDEYMMQEPDQSAQGLDVTDFCKPVEPGIAKCVADHWLELLDDENTADEKVVKEFSEKVSSEITRQVKDALAKQPASEGLEEEVRKYLTDNFTPPGEEPLNTEDAAYTLWFDDVCHIARHFAEWGARHSINWGDVQLLDTFILELSREEKDGADWGDSEKFYTEVLRRFHEFNDKKIPEIVAEWVAEHLKQ